MLAYVLTFFAKPMTLYIFNPEHDLCLANGDPNYVPPASALRFAREGGDAMRKIYGDDAVVIAADDFKAWLKEVCNSQSSTTDLQFNIVPWGWDARLKHILLKQGCPKHLLPDDCWLERLRQLQHRSTVVALQPHASCSYSVEEVAERIQQEQRIVLKAPWSGAGRGIRFVDGNLSEHDRHWVEKVVTDQRCVIVERRLQVKEEYALEYYVHDDKVRQIGLSLFVTQSGVYKNNILIPDEEIRCRVNLPINIERKIEKWLLANVVGRYHGPLGVDMILDEQGDTHVSEINFRHTMGMVAHASVSNN